MKVLIQAFLVLSFLTACAPMCQQKREDMSPEDVLQKYLELALNMRSISDRDELLGYTTGDLKASLAAADEEIIREAYLNKRYKVERFSVIRREDFTPRETQVTYEFAFRESTQNQPDFSKAALVTNENTVAMVRENNKWAISEVVGSATSFDFPISDVPHVSQ